MDNQTQKIRQAWEKYQAKIQDIRKRRREVLSKEDQSYTDKKLTQIRDSLKK